MPVLIARRRAALLFAAVLATSLHALPASGVKDPCAGTEQVAEPVQLCKTNTIRGSQPASIDVVIPEDATISTPFGSSPDLDVQGEGRFVGFVLTAIDTSAPTIIGGRFPAGADARELILPASLYSALGGGNMDFLKFYPDVVDLPAGRYRLYLLTDGSPVEVTLRLGELEGSVGLAPTHPADYRLVFPEARVLGGAGVTNQVYGAGSSNTITGTGLLFHALWLDTEVHVGGQYEFCYRPPGGEDIDPFELGPGCGAVSNFAVANNRAPSTDPDTKMYMEGLDLVPGGRQHLGLWSANESVINDLRYMQFWLSYSP
ncbi:MAG: hypothetical protein ACRDH9_09200 [Actinomycetota bacterium]